MMGFSVLLEKELKEQFRTSRLVAVAIVFILFGILAPLTDRFMKDILDAAGTQAGGMQFTVPDPSLPNDLTQITKNLSQFGIFCAILLAMGSVAWEKERGTAGMLLTKPASRAAFLTAKLMAISLNLLLAVVLGCGLAYVYTVVLYPTAFPVPGYVAMSAILWLALVIFAAVTMFASTVFRSAIAAAGLGFAAFLVIGILTAIPVIGPWSPLALVSGPATDLALGKDAGNFWAPLAFNVALLPVLLGASWLAFRRQEL